MARLKTVYLLREDGKTPAARPQVFMEVTAAGAIVYGVRVCARSLTQARRLAMEEFKKLRQAAKEMKDGKDKEA